jgi:hypothetical protein
MHDALRHVHGEEAVADLVTAFSVTPAKAEAVLRVVASELAWHLERNTLSRAGLADLVEVLGRRDHAKGLEGGDAGVRVEGNAILGRILGSKGGGRALAAHAARRAGLPGETVQAMLPTLAATIMAGIGERASGGLGEVLRVMPPLGRWSLGTPHADLADILRRGCGAGPYGPRKLRRAVRRALAQAAGFRPGGAAHWYVRFMVVRPAATPMRWITARLSPLP